VASGLLHPNMSKMHGPIWSCSTSIVPRHWTHYGCWPMPLRSCWRRLHKPRHDLLYASASLSRLGIARVNPALGSARFFPYDRPMYYHM
jgi:hypothetical protein